ncbi:MAG: beta-propeller domain-containing protein [Candidatus Diapherotrites archaeon]|nr:beta-propeller domain-containing protein [Candidatus Diapherotrites archaeon]
MKKIWILGILTILLIAGCLEDDTERADPSELQDVNDFTQVRASFSEIPTFKSCSAIGQAFAQVPSSNRGYGIYDKVMMTVSSAMPSVGASETSAASSGPTNYSSTNVQVEGVDEADFVKTDGQYLYIISKNHLIIAKAFPGDEAEVLFKQDLNQFNATEMFIQGNTLVLLGSTYEQVEWQETEPLPAQSRIAPDYYPQYNSKNFATIQVWDMTNKSNPNVQRTIDFEGSYLSSRKIGNYAYVAVQSYPDYRWTQLISLAKELNVPLPKLDQKILPLYKDSLGEQGQLETEQGTGFEPVGECGDIGYLPPVQTENFITLASIPLDDFTGEIVKQTVVASGENVYASLNNFYLAEVNYNYYNQPLMMDSVNPNQEENTEETIVHKFALDDGAIEYQGNGSAKGHILNQFSMDEFENNFRIATTIGEVWDSEKPSTNNVYVFDADMKLVGKLEDLAPGEKIYSMRFMGAKGYMVTFKKVDPLFVLDLSDASNPRVLGKLKIPGYSDYLHPFDETHIIGVGKDALDASEEETSNRNLDFAWYQGVKLAIFDVSDVEHPIELHKIVIGDRGTDSYALQDHKAFLFDREKQLLVIPVLLAELTEEQKNLPSNERANAYGDYVIQGAFVYNVNLENGFTEQGRITHQDDPDAFKKSGYYYWGDGTDVKRSLYIDNALYTFSDRKILINDLNDLSLIKQLTLFEKEPEPDYPVYIE